VPPSVRRSFAFDDSPAITPAARTRDAGGAANNSGNAAATNRPAVPVPLRLATIMQQATTEAAAKKNPAAAAAPSEPSAKYTRILFDVATDDVRPCSGTVFNDDGVPQLCDAVVAAGEVFCGRQDYRHGVVRGAPSEDFADLLEETLVAAEAAAPAPTGIGIFRTCQRRFVRACSASARLTPQARAKILVCISTQWDEVFLYAALRPLQGRQRLTDHPPPAEQERFASDAERRRIDSRAE